MNKSSELMFGKKGARITALITIHAFLAVYSVTVAASDEKKPVRSVKVGGRIMSDWTVAGGNAAVEAAVGDIEDGGEFRRIRIFLSGKIYDQFKFKSQYDFAGGEVTIKDMYIESPRIPYLGKVRVGHFIESFSIEDQTSSKYMTFIERGLPVLAFSPGRNAGMRIYNYSDKYNFTWALGLHREAGRSGNSDPGESMHLSGRLTKLLWNSNKGREYLHLGVAYDYQAPRSDTRASFSADPEVHIAPHFLNTGTLYNVERVRLLGLEAVLTIGPVSLQGEYMQSDVDRNINTDETFSGYYAYLSGFITGEHRPYNNKAGFFSRVKPKRNFQLGGPGWGALEVAARYSYLELNGKSVNAGELSDWTLAVNWYLNPYLRWMTNFVRADLRNTGKVPFAVTRFQVDF